MTGSHEVGGSIPPSSTQNPPNIRWVFCFLAHPFPSKSPLSNTLERCCRTTAHLGMTSRPGQTHFGRDEDVVGEQLSEIAQMRRTLQRFDALDAEVVAVKVERGQLKEVR